ncbi:DUF559 domain-containing protein [Microbacterium sp. No. 7]|uniref:DUF559 domain-containing protein n=1 Tax=Microbacterium sp. No. 7 TaxID=1714373 RepID=UPI0006D1190F|nr:DUF559 domain-containing protein [Microbacterium sp. No. 7]
MRPLEELIAWLGAEGGVAHSRAAKAAGFTTHGIRMALAAGSVDRVRRSWLALPHADAELRHAARIGGRLTCLTRARRMGLWTPDHDGMHVAVAPTASRLDAGGVRVHWSYGPAAVVSTALEDPIVNVLFHVARCVPPADALAVWESAIRKKHVAPDVLEHVVWRSERAAAIAAVASELSDSGIETRLAVILRSMGVDFRQQVWTDGHPLDALIGARLAVQVDGFAHHQAQDRRRDLRADARLSLRGYTVLRFDYHQVLFDPSHVIAIISAAIAQGRHR